MSTCELQSIDAMHNTAVPQAALGSRDEQICVERGGPPKGPVFGGANPASVPSHIRHQVDLARGYSHPQLHNISAKSSLDALEALSEHEPLPLANCTRVARRFKGSHFVLNDTKVAAVRISANGWEANILHGLQVCYMLLWPWFTNRADVPVHLSWAP